MEAAERIAMRRMFVFVSGSLALLLALACQVGSEIEAKTCVTPSGKKIPCFGIKIDVKDSLSGIDPHAAYITREVDPAVLAPDSSVTPTGTVTLTLNTGATVSLSQDLSLDPSTQVSATTPGHRVYVYRPADPASIQAFINQYQATTTAADVTSTVAFTDLSGGTVTSTRVDFQGGYNGGSPIPLGTLYVSPAITVQYQNP